MVARTASSSEQYSALVLQDADLSAGALRSLKNEIIGHPERKHRAVLDGLIPNLLRVLQTVDVQTEAKIQAAIVLASLCQGGLQGLSVTPDGDPGKRQKDEERHIIAVLLDCICRPDTCPALVLPCLRALGLLVARGADASLIWSQYLPSLTTLLQLSFNTNKPSFIQQATHVASLMSTYKHDLELENNYFEILLEALIDIVISMTQLGLRIPEATSPQAKLLFSALQALAALTRSNAVFAAQFAAAGRLSPHKCSSDDAPMVTLLLRLIRHANNSIRLGSSSCLTNLYRYRVMPLRYHKDIALSLLPILVRLFDDQSLKSLASFVLTDLVKDSDDMQRAACDAGAIQKLSLILQQRVDSHDERTTESALLALAAITLHRDEYRKQVIDAKVVPFIVSAMNDPAPRVRAAACHCARSLSRSVAILRTSLIDAGIASAVFQLMSDSNMDVKTSATAAICNLVLDFSPMRRTILDCGILRLLGESSQDENAELRLNAVWAIKHIVYTADFEIKESVLRELSPALLMQLCEDPESAIQEQACEVIRNMVCGKPQNIDLLIENIGIEMLADFLIRKLNSQTTGIAVSAIYSLVHIAAGSERHRMIIMQRSGILEALHRHLASEAEEVKIGAVWTIINLTWQEDETTASERRARINALASLGFVERLHQLESDKSLDLRERVKTALAQMQ